MSEQKKLFQNAATDIPAAIVVFLVALPLCLGVALGSNAPLFSGIIAGVMGGLFIAFLSGPSLGAKLSFPGGHPYRGNISRAAGPMESQILQDPKDIYLYSRAPGGGSHRDPAKRAAGRDRRHLCTGPQSPGQPARNRWAFFRRRAPAFSQMGLPWPYGGMGDRPYDRPGSQPGDPDEHRIRR